MAMLIRNCLFAVALIVLAIGETFAQQPSVNLRMSDVIDVSELHQMTSYPVRVQLPDSESAVFGSGTKHWLVAVSNDGSEVWPQQVGNFRSRTGRVDVELTVGHVSAYPISFVVLGLTDAGYEIMRRNVMTARGRYWFPGWILDEKRLNGNIEGVPATGMDDIVVASGYCTVEFFDSIPDCNY